MGDELFVAKDGTPMQMDIPVVNSLKTPLVLDFDFDCQRDCHHKDWQKSDIAVSSVNLLGCLMERAARYMYIY